MYDESAKAAYADAQEPASTGIHRQTDVLEKELAVLHEEINALADLLDTFLRPPGPEEGDPNVVSVAPPSRSTHTEALAQRTDRVRSAAARVRDLRERFDG